MDATWANSMRKRRSFGSFLAGSYTHRSRASQHDITQSSLAWTDLGPQVVSDNVVTLLDLTTLDTWRTHQS